MISDDQFEITNTISDEALHTLVTENFDESWMKDIKYFFKKTTYYKAADISGKPGNFLIDKKNNSLVGMIWYVVYDSSVCWLAWFVVDKKYRGKGLGGKLLRHGYNETKAKYPGISIFLIGTEEMSNYYSDRFEIKPRFSYLRYKISAGEKNKQILTEKVGNLMSNVILVNEEFMNKHRDEFIKYDRQNLKCDRSKAYDHVVDIKTLYAYFEDGQIKGILRSDEFEIYNLFANDDSIAACLLLQALNICSYEKIGASFSEYKSSFLNDLTKSNIEIQEIEKMYFQAQSEKLNPDFDRSYVVSSGAGA